MMRLPVYVALSVFLSVEVLNGCSKAPVVESGDGGVIAIGGSGGSGGGATSGGPTSGGTGTGTSGGTGTGGSGTGMGGSGGTGSSGSGGSGGSGAAVVPKPKSLPGLASGVAGVKPLQGLVSGGRARAIVGARVYVLEENTAGFGQPSVSMLTSATGNPSDSIGYYAVTGAHGGFSIAGDYTCTVGRPVYLYVRGGDSGGSGPNSAIGLMAWLGSCPAAGNFTSAEPFVFVNEVTTVAAAYAMAGVASDPTHVSQPVIAVAAASAGNAANLARVATGVANAAVPLHPATKVPQSKINTLANILSVCVNTTGPGSAGCTALFANARGEGPAGMIPADTAAAAINIAHNPRANTAVLYSLQPALNAPFQPSLESAPEDFTIPVANESQDSVVAFVSSKR
jgi:hypothetical protein